MSNLTAIELIPNNSFATTGLFNQRFSTISANFAALNSDLTIYFPSGETLSVFSNIDASGRIHAGQRMGIGATPSAVTTAVLTIAVDSSKSDYIHFEDSSAGKSNYMIGSRVGGTADGLNLYDLSGDTMIVSFSKQSIRFFQNVVGPVFDVGGALAATLNAATFGTGADSKESRIQAAISAATAAYPTIKRVYIPANMYPYSAASISFDTRAQMVREGGVWTVHDVQAYGAYGDFAHDDDAAINGAISNASGAGGGIVYLPQGDYRIANPLVLAPTVINQITLAGVGRRDVTIRPTASVHTAILIGAVDAKTQYGRITDLTIYAADTSNHTGCGIHMIQPTQFSVDRVNVEGFTQGTGLFLQGQQVSTGSEAVRNIFTQLLVARCQRPIFMRNADENEFYSLICGLETGSTSSVTCIEINQGRNNRFYGLLMQGETASLTTGRPNYIGLYCSTPLTAGGDNQGHSIYGAVAEGFERGIVIPNSGISRLLIFQYNASITSLDLTDSGASTCIISPMAGRFHVPDGFPAIPSPGYSSDKSLGFYRSGNSRIDVAGGSFYVIAGSSTTPGLGFASTRSTGLVDNGGPGLDVVVAGGVAGRALTNAWVVTGGSAVAPSLRFTSEGSLGWYRSSASVLAFSYGQLTNDGGSQSTPAIAFSERSVGLYRSGVSTIAMSAGTFNLATNAVRLSVRTAASLDSTNLAVNEMAFTFIASGASLGIRSGGTIWYFTSSASTKG